MPGTRFFESDSEPPPKRPVEQGHHGGATTVPIALETLTDGGQRPADVARGIAAFLAQARTSLDIALYDVRFETDAGALVLAALLAAVQRGVEVRLLYNVAHPGPIPVPPPPETAPEAIEALPVATRGIAGIPDLMHHKFVVRDGGAVWTGSTNWTDDSWSRQENVIVTIDSREVSYAYVLAFEQLWESGRVAHSGRVDPRPEEVGTASVRAWFCPENGRRSRTESRSTSGKRVPGSGSRRPCSPPARSWPRSSRS